MSVASAARKRAEKLYPSSTSFQGAYVKGAKAAHAGLPREACPYKLGLKPTWRDAYRRAWLRGHNSVWSSDEQR